MKDPLVMLPEYLQFISELKARVLSARISAARSVNRDVVLLYWDIGKGIVEKQAQYGWGESVVKMLARDLQEIFPHTRGFSVQNLWRMRQFYVVHTTPEFLAQASREIAATARTNLKSNLSRPVRDLEQPLSASGQNEFLSQVVRDLLAQVPWGHHANVLPKVKDPAARLYYLRATAQFGWSRKVLLNQIKAGAYERAVTEKKTHNFPAALPEYLAEQAEETLKSSYGLLPEPVERQGAGSRRQPVHRHHPLRGKGRRGGGIRAENQAQSHRGGGVSTAIETAGSAEGQTADGKAAFRCRPRGPFGKERQIAVPAPGDADALTICAY